MASQAHATTYTLPAQFGTGAFSGCAFSSGVTYSCGSVNLVSGDAVNITSPLTINVTSSLVVGDGVQINTLNGYALNISMQTLSSISIGSSDIIYSNISAVSDVSIGASTSINGNVTATGRVITLGANVVVDGNLTATTLNIPSTSKVYGTCSPNNALSCALAGLVGAWKFDETSLTGVAGEIHDTSTNRFHADGTNITTNSSGEMCGSFKFNGTNSSVQVPGSSLVDSAYSGNGKTVILSAWVNPSFLPVSGNAVIIGHGTYSSGITYGTFITVSSTQVIASESAVSSKSGAFYAYAASSTILPLNKWTHLAATFTGKSVSIFINGVMAASWTANASLNTVTLGTTNVTGKPIYIGSSLGGYATFNGSIDEPKIYSSTFSTSSPSAQSIYSKESSGFNWDGTPTPCASNTIFDHVELVHSGVSSTCLPETFTVLLCTTSASCNGLPGNQINNRILNINAYVTNNYSGNPGLWCLDSSCITYVNDMSGQNISVSNGTILYHYAYAVGSNYLIGSATGPLNQNIQCTNTSKSLFDSNSACYTDVSEGGFLIKVPDHTACSPQTISIQAVKASDTSQSCVPMFSNQTLGIYLGLAKINPSSSTALATVYNNFTLYSGTGAYTTYFDSTGTAYLNNFTYPDVGQLSISATTGIGSQSFSSPFNPAFSSHVVGITGEIKGSKSFVVSPAALVISPISSPFVSGAPFQVSVSAYNGCSKPSLTPSFGKETTPASVTLTSSNPLPSSGNSTSINSNVNVFNNGSGTGSASWNEVGTFDLTASSVNYLGSGLTVTTTRANVGPFTPAYFNTAVTPGCGSFTYSGQPFGVKASAMAAGGTVTANYAGANWANNVTLSEANGIPGSFSSGVIPATSFSAGIGTASVTSFSFPSVNTAPSAIMIKAVDSTGVSSAAGTQGTNYIMSGRMQILNAYGSDLIALPLSMKSQYWNGAGFVQNTLDNCTQLQVPSSSSGLASGTLSSAKTFAKVNGASTGYGTLINGDAGLVLTAPGAGNVGYLDVTPTVPSWLQYNWNGTGKVSPKARATFGVSKSPFVYMRENF